jgi:hypothetical protein
VAARERRDQHQVDCLVVADDGLGDFGAGAGEQLAQALRRVLLADQICWFSNHVGHRRSP